MLALVKYGTGLGETELREVPVPKIGEGDLLIEIKAAGICGSDIAYDNGDHPDHLNCPVILGHEFSGVISKVGKNVKDWKVGDRVVSDNTGYVCGKCYACTNGQFLSCPDRLGMGYGMDGGFTDYVKISGELLSRNPNTLFTIPENISFDEAAILDPICNAYKAVIQEGRILPGEDIIVYGVGPLGLFAIQIAKLAGCANIIAVGREKDGERIKIARKYGANHIIKSDKQDVFEEVKRITKGDMAAVCIDAAGANAVMEQAVHIVRTGGRIVRIGYDKRSYGQTLDPFTDRGVSLIGHFGYDYNSWKNILRLLELGKVDLKGMISHHIKLEDWQKGFDRVRSKEAIKIIITKDESSLSNL